MCGVLWVHNFLQHSKVKCCRERPVIQTLMNKSCGMVFIPGVQVTWSSCNPKTSCDDNEINNDIIGNADKGTYLFGICLFWHNIDQNLHYFQNTFKVLIHDSSSQSCTPFCFKYICRERFLQLDKNLNK